MNHEGRYGMIQVLSKVRPHVKRRDKSQLLLSGGIIFLSSISGAISPLFIASIIGRANRLDEATISSLTLLSFLAAFIVTRTIGQLLADVRWIVINPVLYRVVYRYCAHLSGVMVAGSPVERDHSIDAGDVSERIMAIEKAQDGLMGLLYQIFSMVFPLVIELLVILATIGFVIGWQAPVLLFLGFISFGVVIVIGQTRETQSLDRALKADNAVYREMGQYVGNARLANEFGEHGFFEGRLDAAINYSMRLHSAFFKIKMERSFYKTGATTISYGLALACAWYGMNGTAGGIATLFLFITYFDRVLMPLNNAASAVISIRNSLSSVNNALSLIGNMSVQRSVGADIFQNQAIASQHLVLCESPDGGKPDEICIKPGDHVLIKGPSGSGKSTLLLDFYHKIGEKMSQISKPDTGFEASSYQIKAEDVCYLSSISLLVEGTILNNICLGNTSFDRSEVIRLWSIGWQSVAGSKRNISFDQDAATLSNGEKQYLSLVRALLRKPAILLLDEATNAMDSGSETDVWRLIETELPHSTIILVTHRETTPIQPDVSIELVHGRVAGVWRTTRSPATSSGI